MTHSPKPSVPPDDDASLWTVAGLGFQFAAALIAFGYLGQWIDRKLDTAPICLMVGIFLGGGGTFYLSYRRLMAPKPPK